MRHRPSIRSASAFALALGLAAGALPVPDAAARETLAAVTARTARVVVFKDGYSLFEKRCTARLDENARAALDAVPESMVLGSFFALPKEGRIAAVTAGRVPVRRDGRDEFRKRLVFEFDRDRAGAEVEFTLQYYAPGIRWIPAYRFELAAAGAETRMVMQAEILNEAEDLDGVPVDLVVGVPNVRFKRSVSPMSLASAMRDPLAQAVEPPRPLRCGDDEPDFSNAIMAQRIVQPAPAPPPAAAPAEEPAGPALPPELTGEGTQDFHVYKIPALRLRAGERTAIQILRHAAPSRQFFSLDLRVAREGYDGERPPGPGVARPPVRLAKNEVWRILELANGTGHPWTTGSALVMDGDLPVCQELLGYTPDGGRAQLPVTIAVDIAATYVEEETARERGAVRLDGDEFVRVAKRGTVRVTNARREAAELMVSFHAGGNATRASDEGKVTLGDFRNTDWTHFRGNPALTGHSTILWSVRLDPGATRELTCEYEYFVR